MNSRKSRILWISVVVCGALLAQTQRKAPEIREHHNEPIIVDNGPLKITFHGNGHQPNRKQYVKQDTKYPLYIRFWTEMKDDSMKVQKCDVDKDICEIDFSKGVTATLSDGSTITFNKSSEVENYVLMNSSRVEFGTPDGKKKIKAIGEAREVLSVTFTKAGAQAETVMTLRDPKWDPKKIPEHIKVALCVEKNKCK